MGSQNNKTVLDVMSYGHIFIFNLLCLLTLHEGFHHLYMTIDTKFRDTPKKYKKNYFKNSHKLNQCFAFVSYGQGALG